MKTLTIQVPDDFKLPEGYEVKIVKKEEKKRACNQNIPRFN